MIVRLSNGVTVEGRPTSVRISYSSDDKADFHPLAEAVGRRLLLALSFLEPKQLDQWKARESRLP